MAFCIQNADGQKFVSIEAGGNYIAGIEPLNKDQQRDPSATAFSLECTFFKNPRTGKRERHTNVRTLRTCHADRYYGRYLRWMGYDPVFASAFFDVVKHGTLEAATESETRMPEEIQMRFEVNRISFNNPKEGLSFRSFATNEYILPPHNATQTVHAGFCGNTTFASQNAITLVPRRLTGSENFYVRTFNGLFFSLPSPVAAGAAKTISFVSMPTPNCMFRFEPTDVVPAKGAHNGSYRICHVASDRVLGVASNNGQTTMLEKKDKDAPEAQWLLCFAQDEFPSYDGTTGVFKFVHDQSGRQLVVDPATDFSCATAPNSALPVINSWFELVVV